MVWANCQSYLILEKQSEMFKADKCIPFIAATLCSIIALLNPSIVVLSSDLINEKMLETVREMGLSKKFCHAELDSASTLDIV